MTAIEKRKKILGYCKETIGRNKYSQAKRAYCSKPYKDGLYYSDCSSNVADAHRRAGFPIRYSGNDLPNTVGMYLSKDLVDVDIIIKNGVIQNPEVLREGDILLFAGNDASRANAGFVGHVEIVYAISDGKVTIFGHGSGTPRTTEMNAYCKSRFARKADTKLGNRGLIKVRRRIQDDISKEPSKETKVSEGIKMVEITGGKVNVREGAGTSFKSAGVVKKGEKYEIVCEKNGFVPIFVGGEVRWVSKKYVKEENT